MNTRNRHGNQSGSGPLVRGFRDQETLLAIIEALDYIADDLAEGQIVKATDAMRGLAAYALNASRNVLADHASLTGFPPLHAIDAELHKRRRPLLERKALEFGMTAKWFGEEFAATDDDGHLLLEVDGADNWRLVSNSPDWFVADSGLTTLLAAMRGEPVACVVSSVHLWLWGQEVR